MTIILNNRCGSYTHEVASLDSAKAFITEEMKAGRADSASIREGAKVVAIATKKAFGRVVFALSK